MDIHREKGFLIDSDLQGRLSIGIQSRNIDACIAEVIRQQAYGVFGSPSYKFHEDNLNFLVNITHVQRVWFWDILLKDIDGLYALKRLKHFGVHPKRPPISFSHFPQLEEMVWFYKSEDTGLASLQRLRTLQIWHYNPTHKSLDGLELPGKIEKFEINWSNTKSLSGLPKMPNLKELGIHRCRNLETLQELPSLAPNLEHLVVASCGRVMDGPNIVRRLPRLRHAYVRDAVLVSQPKMQPRSIEDQATRKKSNRRSRN